MNGQFSKTALFMKCLNSLRPKLRFQSMNNACINQLLISNHEFTWVSGGNRYFNRSCGYFLQPRVQSFTVCRHAASTSHSLRLTRQKMREKVQKFIHKENVATVPNMLCVSRIVLSPVLAILVLQHNFNYALAVFLVAGATDLLDGMIARKFPSQQSMLGSFLDPMADKLLISTLVLSLTATDLIPVPLTALIVSRDVCLFAAGCYIRYLSLPSPKTWNAYFDLTRATAKLSPTLISKVNTSVQLSLVASTLAAAVCHVPDHPYLYPLWCMTAATTVISGISYIFSRDTFRVLRRPRLSAKRHGNKRAISKNSSRDSVAQQNY